MKKNTKVLLGGGVVAAAILFLLVAATPGSSGLELSIEQIQANTAKYSQGNYIKTQGDIIGDSIQWNADKIELTFDVKDDKGKILHVVHQGVKPDNFSEGIIAILEGTLQPDGTFKAEKVQTRCPSKYEGKDMKDYDPKTHQELQKKAAEVK